MKTNFSAFLLGSMTLLCANALFAAETIDLSGKPVTLLKSFLPDGFKSSQSPLHVQETSKNKDFNQTTHIRIRETYQGYPVWGSEAVVHLPKEVTPSLTAVNDPVAAAKISMNGVMYQGLQNDLSQTPAYVFSKAQADKAVEQAVRNYKEEVHAPVVTSDAEAKLMVYVDDNQQAHWIFKVSFLANRASQIPARPVYLLDAVTFKIYQHWNDIKTASATVLVPGGGIGGNGRMGKMIYDGLQSHRPVLSITRNMDQKLCLLQNDTVIIRDARNRNKVPAFKCAKPDEQHNNVYWNTLDDAVNGGYSPNNDGLYSDQIVRAMYMKWFNIPMLTSKNGKPMQVNFYVHDETLGWNAYYDKGEMHFGDGDDDGSYPVVAPSVVAHEMSHGFTEQHADLVYDHQSGGINEAFSDMADKSVEYFVEGTNNWDIDPELLKENGKMLRYMDDPTKDCEGREPGNDCSIDHVKYYNSKVDVHHSSGVFNKAFYLISTAWDTRRAFEVMVQANMHYWTPNTTFAQAACGVVKAAKDYKYDDKTIRNAMAAVGVKTSKC